MNLASDPVFQRCEKGMGSIVPLLLRVCYIPVVVGLAEVHAIVQVFGPVEFFPSPGYLDMGCASLGLLNQVFGQLLAVEPPGLRTLPESLYWVSDASMGRAVLIAQIRYRL